MNQQVKHVAPDACRLHPENPRVGDVGAIKQSIEAHGFYGVIVAQESTGYVLAGNHRLKAAKELGLETVPVAFIDVDDDKARRILLADNRTADQGGYNDETLLDLLERLDGLEGTGYTGDDLDDLLVSLEGALTAPEQEFHGGYAETPEEAEQRRAKGGHTRAANGLVDVVLAYTMNDYATFARAIKEETDGALTTSQAVLRIMERACRTK